jgi:hypothetical protein
MLLHELNYNIYFSYYSDGTSIEEDVGRLMKVAWMSLPLGIFVAIVACLFVFWWQQISYFSPYGQAVLINGNPMKLIVISFFSFSSTSMCNPWHFP